MTLLIADDSPGKILLIEGMLFRHSWQGNVVIARTTEEAKRLIDAHDVTHGLIDFYIPSENGPAIIAYLKQRHPASRVALVSSSDTSDNTDAAKKAGAEICICTSYPADEVERAFADLLGEWLEAES